MSPNCIYFDALSVRKQPISLVKILKQFSSKPYFTNFYIIKMLPLEILWL